MSGSPSAVMTLRRRVEQLEADMETLRRWAEQWRIHAEQYMERTTLDAIAHTRADALDFLAEFEVTRERKRGK